MALEISSTLLERLLSEVRSAPDREVCGLLFGSAEWIEGAQACANVAADPSCTFEIDPVALFAAHRAARHGGPQLVGHYHSHPSGTAEPSGQDAAAAGGDGAVWLIIAGTDTRFYRAVEGGRLLGQFEQIEVMARSGKISDIFGILGPTGRPVPTIDEINEAIAAGWAGEPPDAGPTSMS